MRQSIFLGEKGITSSSANFLANLAKEQLKTEEAILNNLTFINSDVELINGEVKALHKGVTDIDLQALLDRIASLHGFCAWVREAIKDKEAIGKEISNLDFYEYCEKVKGQEAPKLPKLPKIITKEDILSEMNVKERNNYLSLEACASTYGQYIHPDGAISSAREDVLKKVNNPHATQGTGRDMIIYTYSPSMEVEKINTMYTALQGKYRDYERQLNALKYSINEKVDKRSIEARNKYNALKREYDEIIHELEGEMDVYMREELNKLNKLKIVIPEKLTSIYEYLESLVELSKN